MQVTISFDASAVGSSELSAVIAFCLSLGGDIPDTAQLVGIGGPPAMPVMPEVVERQTLAPAAPVERAAPPPPPTNTDNDGPVVSTADLDAEGIPWDDRIHSTPAKQNADGTWRKKRGVTEVLYGQIHAELQERVAAGNTAERAAPLPPPTNTETPSSATGAGPTSEPTAPPPPANEGNAPPPPADNAPTAAGQAATAPAANASAGGERFPSFAVFVQSVNSCKTPALNYVQLNELAQTLGVDKFVSMKDRAELWDTFYDMAAA